MANINLMQCKWKQMLGRRCIVVTVLLSWLLVGCSSDTTSVTKMGTDTPIQLRSVNPELLSVHVTLNDGSEVFYGVPDTDGTWTIPIHVDLDQQHTFVANWYSTVGSKEILVLQQTGSFYADSTIGEATPQYQDFSTGNALFDSDCDGASNLTELNASSNPLDLPGCNEPDTISNDPVNANRPTPHPRIPDMVRIEGDCFNMGSDESDFGHQPDQRSHEVCLNAYEIGRYEVTFEQYTFFSGAAGVVETTPPDNAWGEGDRPVMHVNWLNATAYAQWLSDYTGDTYRLPTEAEWEYAARGGSTARFWTGDTIRGDEENFDQQDPWGGGVAVGPNYGKTTPVGTLQANPYGLYDILGNVMEWTCSEYNADYNGQENDCSDDTQKQFVMRGGHYKSLASGLVSYLRIPEDPNYTDFRIGFRIVRAISN